MVKQIKILSNMRCFFIFILFFLANILISKPANNFDGISFDYNFNNNQHSFNFGAKCIGEFFWVRGPFVLPLDFWGIDNIIGDSIIISGNYSFQLNLFGGDIIPQDKYNNNDKNASYAPTLLSSLWMGAGMLIIHKYHYNRYDYKYKNLYYAIVFFPTMLINSEHHLILNNTKSITDDIIAPSVYFRSKLDYFAERENKFIRYKPELGISLTYLFKGKSTKGPSLNLGIDYQFDFFNNKVLFNGFEPCFSVKYFYGE